MAEQMDANWVNHVKDWRLNEKSYGALEGLEKQPQDSTLTEYYKSIRDGYDTKPPALTIDDVRHPGNDRKYFGIPIDSLPSTESLKCVEKRVSDFWKS